MLPIWRSTLCRMNISMERMHGKPKQKMVRHSNNQDKSLKFLNNRGRFVSALQYLDNGGGFGPNLNIRISERVRNMRDPLNPNQRLFQSAPELPLLTNDEWIFRVDKVSGRKLDLFQQTNILRTDTKKCWKALMDSLEKMELRPSEIRKAKMH